MLAPAPAKITTMLDNALAAQRLSHALIFSGVDGSGREATSYALTRDLLCLDTTSSKACGSCTSCSSLAPLDHHGCSEVSHPDFHFLRPEGQNIKVEAVRQAIEQAWLSPLLSKAKVFIIFDAHLLNPNGANALLKTLEEPPQHTFFILLTPGEASLLQTIRSRCQSFGFPLPAARRELSHEQERAVELLREANFEGLHQVLVKGSQLSKKSVSAAERRSLIKGFLDALMQAIADDLRQATEDKSEHLLAQQETLLEAQRDLLANVKLDLLLQGLTIRLARG